MYKTFFFFIIPISLLFTACTKQLDKNDYIRWVQDYDNELHTRKVSSDFVFDLQYQPASYLALVGNKPVTLPQEDDGDMQYYVLKIGMQRAAGDTDIFSYNTPTVADKQRRIYYYSYLFQNDLYLEEGEKKLPCLLFHFEQSGLRSSGTFVLGFEKPSYEDPVKESTLVIDSPQFGSFPVKLKVSKQNIPLLKI